MPSGELPVEGIVEIEDTMIRSAILVLVLYGALPGVLGGKFWTKRIIYLFIYLFIYEHYFNGGLITRTNTVNSDIFASVFFAYAKLRENKILAKWRNHSVIFRYR